MRVAVCIITYRRPEGLAQLLDGLNRLTFDREPAGVRCIVVDNDTAGVARTVCDGVRPGFRWELECHVEPRRGIPHARNKAVACAKDQADFIAFLDDDEVPEPGWLAELIRVQGEYEADVVTGPVVAQFTGDVPAWALKGGFYEGPRHATGSNVDRAFTGNVLFRAALADGMEPVFDPRLALSGGEDVHFFCRIRRSGHKIVWADDAVVHERTPASRVSPRWILQRAFRIGTTTAYVESALRPLPVAVGLVLAVACYRMLKGTLLWPVTWVFGRHWRIRYLRQLCYGAGMLVGLTGLRYEEYRRTHGT